MKKTALALKRSVQPINLQGSKNSPNQSIHVLAIVPHFHHTARHRVIRRGDAFHKTLSNPPEEATTCAGFSL